MDRNRHLQSILDAFDLAVGTVERLQRLRLPWWHLWRAAEAAGAATPKRPVIFECVGVPGIIDGIIASAPLFSRVVVVGVCMGSDHIRPAMAINKEINLRFVLGYTPLEFRDTLHMLADGSQRRAADHRRSVYPAWRQHSMRSAIPRRTQNHDRPQEQRRESPTIPRGVNDAG